MARITIASLTKDLADYKAQVTKLGAENAALRAQVAALQMNADIAARKAKPVGDVCPTDHLDYSDYMEACRAQAAARGRKVVIHIGRAAFEAAHAQH